MNTEIDIQGLVNSVMNSQDEKQQRKLEAIQKRCQWLQQYSQEKEVKEIERIPVIPSTITTVYETEHKKTWKLGNSKTIDCGTETAEHEVKDKVITEEDIINSIKAIHPDHVENTLYWYDNGKYLFTTDKGEMYNLKSTPRPFSKDEKETIKNLVNEVLTNKVEVESIMRTAKIVVLHNTNEEELSIEDRELKQQTLGEYTLYFFTNEREFNKRKSLHTLGENGDLDIYGRTFKEYIIHDVRMQAKKAKLEHNELVNKTIEEIYKIKSNCDNEPQYYIHNLKQKNQVKIYIGKNLKGRYTRLGYKVYEDIKSNKVTNWTEVQGEIKEEEKEYNKTLYHVQMSSKAFKSCCYHGKVCKKGCYFNEQGNEIEQGRRPKEQVTLTDEKGNTYTFNSKTEAAKELNVSQALITKAVKNGGLLNLANGKNNKKSIKLLTTDYTLIECTSFTELAQKLNTNKMKVSRAIKGKNKGDVVAICGTTYTVVG